MKTFLIRWPDSDLKEKLQELAVRDRRSLHGEILFLLEQWVSDPPMPADYDAELWGWLADPESDTLPEDAA